MRSPPPVGAWASALRVVGRAPHQPDDHHLRPWSRGARGDSEEEDPTGAMALSYLRRCEVSRYQGPEYRPQPAHAGPTRLGFVVSS